MCLFQAVGFPDIAITRMAGFWVDIVKLGKIYKTILLIFIYFGLDNWAGIIYPASNIVSWR
jgi:hypothetical protein